MWVGVVTLRSPQGPHERLAAVSVGRRLSYHESRGTRLLEAHLLDFTGDLYGQFVVVELFERVRGQLALPGSSALVEQMHAEVAAVRAWVRGDAR